MRRVVPLVLAVALCFLSGKAAAINMSCIKYPQVPPLSPSVRVSWGPREGSLFTYHLQFNRIVPPPTFVFHDAGSYPISTGSFGWVIFYLFPGGEGTWDVFADGVSLPRYFPDSCYGQQVLP
jgi:hypothetical protein